MRRCPGPTHCPPISTNTPPTRRVMVLPPTLPPASSTSTEPPAASPSPPPRPPPPPAPPTPPAAPPPGVARAPRVARRSKLPSRREPGQPSADYHGVRYHTPPCRTAHHPSTPTRTGRALRVTVGGVVRPGSNGLGRDRLVARGRRATLPLSASGDLRLTSLFLTSFSPAPRPCLLTAGLQCLLSRSASVLPVGGLPVRSARSSTLIRPRCTYLAPSQRSGSGSQGRGLWFTVGSRVTRVSRPRIRSASALPERFAVATPCPV